MVYGIISQAHREQDNFEQLKEIVKQPFLAFDPSQTQEPPETDDASSPYAALKEINQDFWGWICIEGTELDYPVMHTPKNMGLIAAAFVVEDAGGATLERLMTDAPVDTMQQIDELAAYLRLPLLPDAELAEQMETDERE